MKRKSIPALLLCFALLVLCVPARAADRATVRIAFLDTGVSVRHLDASRVETGENLILPDRDTDDRIGHGTATAGLVLGSEELGLAGLCSEAVVVPLVCYDLHPNGAKAQGTAQTVAAAIRAAVDVYDCRILNISMGLKVDSPVLREAVAYAQARGALIVSAVGNDNTTSPKSVFYPAAYDGVLGVGAANGLACASFSQRSSVDVLAEGVKLQTVPRSADAQIEYRSGTSFSCAVVTGLCAAIWAQNPEWTAEQVTAKLLSTALDVDAPGCDANTGWGIVSPSTTQNPALQLWRQFRTVREVFPQAG